MAGKNADNIGHQSSGWTISWQGGSGAVTPGTSILQGIRNTVAPSTVVTYNQAGAGVNNTCNVAIAVVGETPYAEGAGDRPGSMSLDTADINTINTLRTAGIPVVVVLVSGRPMDIASQLPNWNSLVAAWLPGSEGQGVADILFGVAQPTGKLPMTWMNSVGQQPINTGDGQTPLFPYGFGLTYGPPPTRDAYAVTQAESYSTQSGTQLEHTSDAGGGQNVGWIAPGDWLAYANVDFGTPTATTVTTRRASGSAATGTIQYRLDSTTGPIIASVPVSNTGGWQSWGSVTTTLSGSATGVHTVYVTFIGSGGDFVNLNWFQFARPGATRDPYLVTRRRVTVRSRARRRRQRPTPAAGSTSAGSRRATGWLTPMWISARPRPRRSPRDAPLVRPRRARSSTGWTPRPGRSHRQRAGEQHRRVAELGQRHDDTLGLGDRRPHAPCRLYNFDRATGSGGDFVNINWFQFAR